MNLIFFSKMGCSNNKRKMIVYTCVIYGSSLGLEDLNYGNVATPFYYTKMLQSEKININLYYLKKHRESNSLLIVKVGVFIDERDVVLVQFTSSFAVLLG